jgi:hypothetical protein
LIAKRIEREKEKKCKTGATRKQEKHKKKTPARERKERKKWRKKLIQHILLSPYFVRKR